MRKLEGSPGNPWPAPFQQPARPLVPNSALEGGPVKLARLGIRWDLISWIPRSLTSWPGCRIVSTMAKTPIPSPRPTPPSRFADPDGQLGCGTGLAQTPRAHGTSFRPPFGSDADPRNPQSARAPISLPPARSFLSLSRADPGGLAPYGGVSMTNMMAASQRHYNTGTFSRRASVSGHWSGRQPASGVSNQP